MPKDGHEAKASLLIADWTLGLFRTESACAVLSRMRQDFCNGLRAVVPGAAQHRSSTQLLRLAPQIEIKLFKILRHQRPSPTFCLGV